MTDASRAESAGADGTEDAEGTGGAGRRAGVLAYLLLLQFAYSWAWNSADILRPLFRSALDLSLAEAGAGYTAQVVGALLGGLAAGRVERELGTRGAFTLTTVGCGAAMLGGAAITGLLSLIAQRLVLGLFMGAVFPLTVGMLVRLFPPERRGRLASVIDGTYFAAAIALGWTVALLDRANWRASLWMVGLATLAIAAGALAIPRSPRREPGEPGSLLARLFHAAHRRRTILLAVTIGANACGYQAFTGWLTTYLVEVRALAAGEVATVVTAQFSGSIAGCFCWGWIVDRSGRRAGGFGMGAAGIAAALFLVMPPAAPALAQQGLAFVVGWSFAAVVTLGPWIAELYPPELRTAATSIFGWGRFLSLLVPPLTGFLAASVGLAAVMMAAGAALVLAAILWRTLPETHRPRE